MQPSVIRDLKFAIAELHFRRIRGRSLRLRCGNGQYLSVGGAVGMGSGEWAVGNGQWAVGSGEAGKGCLMAPRFLLSTEAHGERPSRDAQQPITLPTAHSSLPIFLSDRRLQSCDTLVNSRQFTSGQTKDRRCRHGFP